MGERSLRELGIFDFTESEGRREGRRRNLGMVGADRGARETRGDRGRKGGTRNRVDRRKEFGELGVALIAFDQLRLQDLQLLPHLLCSQTEDKIKV